MSLSEDNEAYSCFDEYAREHLYQVGSCRRPRVILGPHMCVASKAQQRKCLGGDDAIVALRIAAILLWPLDA
jgi:hypothetical protein